jgi:DNA modification methylase
MSDLDHRSDQATILVGDCVARLREFAEGSARCCITSPPYYGLRDYGVAGQIGAEQTPEEYVARLVEVFREVRRVLTDDGTLWLNLGDSYGRENGPGNSGARGKNNPAALPQRRAIKGIKQKDLIGIPWMVAFALRGDGWYLRSDIIWHKPNVMPESVRDRPTKAHEYLFLFSKSPDYYYDADAIREPFVGTNDHDRTGGRYRPPGQTPHGRDGSNRGTVQANGRNRRTVWSINTKPFRGAHFAVFPTALVEPCVLAGSARGDTVLDPFMGSGTTCVVAAKHGRAFAGTELNPEYVALARSRIRDARHEECQS